MSFPFVFFVQRLTLTRLRHLPSAALAILLACAGDFPTSPSEEPRLPGPSTLSAVAEDTPFNAVFVKAKLQQGYLGIEGTTWVDDDGGRLIIALLMKAEVGVTQVIGSSPAITADVVYDPTYDEGNAWTASPTMGSGTLTITTLSANSATGTFSFTARAHSDGATPLNYRVTNGSFNVSF